MIAATSQPNTGIWGVAVLAGYLTLPGQEAGALAMVKHMLASRQWNPQWDEAMRDQAREALNQQTQRAAQFMAQLQRQQQQWSAMLFAKSEVDQAALTASHNAFINQMNRQSDANNENFRNYQAQRSLNSWNFDAQIRNGKLYRNTDTGVIFEVDH